MLTIFPASLRHQDLRAQPDIIQVLYGTVGGRTDRGVDKLQQQITTYPVQVQTNTQQEVSPPTWEKTAKGSQKGPDPSRSAEEAERAGVRRRTDTNEEKRELLEP